MGGVFDWTLIAMFGPYRKDNSTKKTVLAFTSPQVTTNSF